MLTQDNDLPQTSPYSPFPSNLFLLNPHNRNMLRGVRALSVTFSLTTVMLLIGLCGLLASGLCFAKGISDLFATAQLIANGVIVQGRIVNYQPHTANGVNQGVLHPVVYRFTLPNRPIAFTRQQLVRKEFFDRFTEGAAVTVRYLPSDPMVSMLVGVDAESGFEGSAFGSIAVGAVGLLVGAVYLWPVLRQLWRDIRLKQEGCVTPGQVLYCRRYALLTAVQRDSPEYDAAIANNFYIELSYRFRTPEGKELRGWTKQKRNDLRGTRLPTFGAPVAVLYLDRENFNVL